MSNVGWKMRFWLQYRVQPKLRHFFSYFFVVNPEIQNTVKSRFNEWPNSAHFDSLNRDFTLNRNFLMWNSILVTRFRSLNQDFSLNRDSLNRDFTVQRFSDLPEGSGPAIFSVKPGNSVNPKVLMANMSLGLRKYSVKPGIPLKTIPVNPKISVFR